MSRSYKKYGYIGSSSSDKFSKREVHKKLRSKCKIIINKHDDPDNMSLTDLPTKDDIKDIYYYAKDDGVDVSKERNGNYLHFTKDGKLRK